MLLWLCCVCFRTLPNKQDRHGVINIYNTWHDQLCNNFIIYIITIIYEDQMIWNKTIVFSLLQDGRTALHLACRSYVTNFCTGTAYSTITSLLEHEADLTIKDNVRAILNKTTFYDILNNVLTNAANDPNLPLNRWNYLQGRHLFSF